MSRHIRAVKIRDFLISYARTQGYGISEIAFALNMSGAGVFASLRRTGTHGANTTGPCSNLHDEIAADFRSGMTMDDVGKKYGVSRERIRQILVKHGVGTKEGGAAVRALWGVEQRDNRSKAQRDARAKKYYGCDYETVVRLSGGDNLSRSSGRAYSFRQQRSSAANRGIRWNLSFEEWCAIWDESGKEPLRGRGRGKYVMARHSDSGPYEKANVKIILFEENAAASFDSKPSEDRQIGAVRPTERINGIPKRCHAAYALYQNDIPVSEIGVHLGISTKTAAQYVNAAKRVNGVYAKKYGEAQ